MVNGHGKSQPLEPQVARAIEVDRANETLQRLIGQWDQYALAQRQLLPGMANALAVLQAAAIRLTGVQQDPATGQVTAIAYQTQDGAAHTLVIERPKAPPRPQIIVPRRDS